jgi:hypothetical protein
LRSESAALIEMPKNARTKIYGERRFDVAAGTRWNSLPASLRKKRNQIELKRRKLRIIRELGKTYLKILIKIKV